MRKLSLLALLIIEFSLIFLSGCKFFNPPETPKGIPPEQFGKKYTVENIKLDLDFLVRTLEDVHPDLYAYTAQKIFLKEYRSLKQKLTSPLTRIEFYFHIAPLVAMLKDGHTKVYPVYEEYYHYRRKGGLLFPLDVNIQDDETIVTANYSSDQIPAPGSILLSINERKTSTLIDEWLPLVSGKRLVKRLDYLSDFHFYRHFLWLTCPSDSLFTLKFIPHNEDKIITHTVTGVTYQNIIKKRQLKNQKQNHYSYQTLSDTIGLLTISLFPGNEEAFGKFLKKVFGELKQKKIQDLIIDIRNNGGGFSPAEMELLRYLTDKPIARIPRMDIKVSRQIKKYYRLSMPKLFRWFPMQWFHPAWRKIWKASEGSIVTVSSDPKKLKNTPLRFKGNIYVLIGPGTFSTAADFGARIKDYDLGELVGAETGGLATSFGAFYPFRLPYTKLLIRVSHKRIYRPNGEDKGRGVLPHHLVSITNPRGNISLGLDTVLRYTVELIKSRNE